MKLHSSKHEINDHSKAFTCSKKKWEKANTYLIKPVKPSTLHVTFKPQQYLFPTYQRNISNV